MDVAAGGRPGVGRPGAGTGSRRSPAERRRAQRWARLSAARALAHAKARAARAACTGGGPEVEGRLAAVRPVLQALLRGDAPSALERLRRNVALHALAAPEDLASAPAAALRAAQRGPRLGAGTAAEEERPWLEEQPAPEAAEHLEGELAYWEECFDEAALQAAWPRAAAPAFVPGALAWPGETRHQVQEWLPEYSLEQDELVRKVEAAQLLTPTMRIQVKATEGLCRRQLGRHPLCRNWLCRPRPAQREAIPSAPS